MTDYHASDVYWSRQLGCASVPQRMMTLPPDDDPYRDMPQPPTHPIVFNLPQETPSENTDASLHVYIRERLCLPERHKRSCNLFFFSAVANLSSVVASSVWMIL